MINILLICSAGMSTSMLVTKMQNEAENRDLEANIWSVGDASASEAVEKADVILLGPQVRYLLEKTKGLVNNEKPVMVIDMVAYGTMNGKKVLDDALKLKKEF